MDKINVFAEEQIKDVFLSMVRSSNKLGEVELENQVTDNAGMGRLTRQVVLVYVRKVKVT